MSLSDFNTKVQSILAGVETEVKAITAKIPLSQGWAIIQTALAQTVLAMEQSVGNTLANPDKKAQVMTVAGQIADVVLDSINIPYMPAWGENLIDKYLKMLILDLVSGSTDALVSTFRTTGIFTTPAGQTPAPSTKGN